MSLGRLIALTVLVAAVPATAGVTLEERLLLDDRVRMLVPSSFKPMNERRLKVKYPNTRPPQFVLTNRMRGRY